MDDNSENSKGQLTIKLQSWCKGNIQAGKEVIQISYQRLVSMAGQAHINIQGLSLNPQEVVHESFERLQKAVQQNPPTDSIAFYNLASHVLHNTCVDLLRKKLAIKRRPPENGSTVTNLSTPADHSMYQLLHLLETLEQLHPRQAQSFKLHCVAGFTIEETASMTTTSEATVSRDVTFSRHWLAAKLA